MSRKVGLDVGLGRGGVSVNVVGPPCTLGTDSNRGGNRGDRKGARLSFVCSVLSCLGGSNVNVTVIPVKYTNDGNRGVHSAVLGRRALLTMVAVPGHLFSSDAVGISAYVVIFGTREPRYCRLISAGAGVRANSSIFLSE